MKHLALLASVYALVVGLVLPGTILAQDETPPATTETAPAEQAAPPAPAAEQAPPAAEQPAPAPAAPEPQVLADETAEAPPESPPKAIAAASGSVTISDFSFSPGTITINQGETVTWVNNGPTPHSATSSSGAFDTGIFQKGQSRSHTFNEAGTFAYICTPHPFMKGTVVVQGADTGGGGGEGDASGSGTADTGAAADTGATAAQDEGPTLPNTGGDSGALLMLGGLMLLLGIAVHRRSAEQEPRPAGRIGW
jgi:amicyanin